MTKLLIISSQLQIIGEELKQILITHGLFSLYIKEIITGYFREESFALGGIDFLLNIFFVFIIRLTFFH